ncbi:unnamed protein product, partial [Mesorhabditis spiculigera]
MDASGQHPKMPNEGENNVDSKEASPASTNPPPSTDNLDEVDSHTTTRKDEPSFQYFPCRFCGLTFNYLNTLRAHERVHNVDEPYVCGKCGESFHFACELEYHSMHHNDGNGFKCDCGRTFFSYTELLYHRHPDEEPAPKRVQDSFQPVTSVPLQFPSTSAHGALQFAPIEVPVPAYKTEGFEPKHPLKVYKGDVRTNPYICEYCSKSYPDSRQLTYHMYSHRGERNFNPRSSRYLMGRSGVGYTDPPLFRY